MKITELKLRRIIQKVITESTENYIDPDQQLYNDLYDNLDSYARTNMSRDTLISKLRQQSQPVPGAPSRRQGLEGATLTMIEEVVDDWIITNRGEL